jgi:hypothetical protein
MFEIQSVYIGLYLKANKTEWLLKVIQRHRIARVDNNEEIVDDIKEQDYSKHCLDKVVEFTNKGNIGYSKQFKDFARYFDRLFRPEDFEENFHKVNFHSVPG